MTEKLFKSSNDVRLSTNQLNDSNHQQNVYQQQQTQQQLQRNSLVSQSDSSETGRMVSGNKRNLPKHQRPLTRYLPIMSLDLDLKQHIETAGHQVNLCPHIIIDSFSCRG